MVGSTGGSNTGPGSVGRRRRPYRVVVPVAAVIVVVVLAVSVPLVVASGNGADAAVRTAVGATVARRSASVTWQLKTRERGRTFSLWGSGNVDFTKNASTLSVTGKVAGQMEQFRMVTVGTTYYVRVPGAPDPEPGKPWVSFSLDQQDAGSDSEGTVAGHRVAGVLGTLVMPGVTARALGTTSDCGQSLQTYGMTLDPTSPHPVTGTGSGVLPGWLSPPTSHVVARVCVRPSGTVGSVVVHGVDRVLGVRSTASDVVTYGTFGKPVSISVPPRTSVVTGQQLPSPFTGPGVGNVLA